jgi:hypothetical protein
MSVDQLFQRAVALIGAGDVPALERLLADHPELARERLAAPGPWLRDKVGGALDGYAHGTPLHHAVCSGPLATVQALVESGALPGERDSAWNGTPLGWAEHYLAERKDADSQRRYGEVADYLRGLRPHAPA